MTDIPQPIVAGKKALLCFFVAMKANRFCGMSTVNLPRFGAGGLDSQPAFDPLDSLSSLGHSALVEHSFQAFSTGVQGHQVAGQSVHTEVGFKVF